MIDKIMTNNPLVKAEFADRYDILYYELPLNELLVQVRDYIHKGHKLLTHPLSGSVKPNETPYKSVLVSGDAGKLDMDSVMIIEDSIICSRKFEVKYPDPPAHVLADFQEIDRTLIAGALCNHRSSL